MTKIMVYFDGTGNEPEDAEQEIENDGKIEDNNISNVLKMHLRVGGRLDSTQAVNGQVSLYFTGPGTRGWTVRRVVQSALATRSLDKIMKEALVKLQDIYQPGDEISVFGFSRGAAIARRFVSNLQRFGFSIPDKGEPPAWNIPVRFMGVWDTVLSEGKPQKDQVIRKPSELGEESGIGSSVGRVFHLVSIDDPRIVFTPTLFNPDERVSEIWFAGVHSDVGGGYLRSGLSDIALEFMIEQAKEEAELSFLDLVDVDPETVTGGLVKRNDIISNRNVAEEDHSADFDRVVKNLFDALKTRNVHTINGGVPILHDSVVKRGAAMGRYRPKNLRNLKHTVWGREELFDGFSRHFE